MAFNFSGWQPLLGNTGRAKEMLTSALNKSPKPPIIVDDIIVEELNLGATPPELEILEIGDLAEDRFRGIFKMSYTGDAYLTLKTRVQANPLNTYLSTKPSFASPQPLAASSSLTIPIQITLSEIRLSGFVILVFSKTKGITIVFRNDPLEKLKVSSTFDSIPFVRDYLQKTIENQLRVLFMEDLPAIIHRLSLQKFSPEYQTAENQEPKTRLDAGDVPIDPLASPALQPLDGEAALGAPFTLDPPAETYASFSQKNMIRLATLAESQRTLSLFTPGMRDTVYRAWACAYREELNNGTASPTRPGLARLHTSIASRSAVSSATSLASGGGTEVTRPSLVSMSSAATVYSLGSSASRTRPKRRKHRVVNLRKNKDDKDANDAASVGTSGYDESASRTGSSPSLVRSSTEATSATGSKLREGEISTPPRSPKKKVDFHKEPAEAVQERPQLPRSRPITPKASLNVDDDVDQTPRASMYLPQESKEIERGSATMNQLPRMQAYRSRDPSPEVSRRPSLHDYRRSSSELKAESRTSSEIKLHSLFTAFSEGGSGGILERAWMEKMATEIAKKVEQERAKQKPWHAPSEAGIAEDAPPAYVS
ncbi:Putative mitochondrial distribution and morphology protein [Septoria linicola]|uniref:Mitochondrial distribution and morphology protein 34 n=1 Tax=Septoria linicola TaxID=215465 RepID=A0A9Q9EIM1_9PEZI|nr:putative mitochondrial distribution and morphology protein [Septoria linicola]USW52170.1 Putative mitochondrial distribution and morphology protein [Septoria linicola]